MALSHSLHSGLSLITIAFLNCSSLWLTILGARLKLAFLQWVEAGNSVLSYCAPVAWEEAAVKHGGVDNREAEHGRSPWKTG